MQQTPSSDSTGVAMLSGDSTDRPKVDPLRSPAWVIAGVVLVGFIACLTAVTLSGTPAASHRYLIAVGGGGNPIPGLNSLSSSPPDSVGASLWHVLPGVATIGNGSEGFVRDQLLGHNRTTVSNASHLTYLAPVVIGVTDPGDTNFTEMPTDVTLWTAPAANVQLSNQVVDQLKWVYSIGAPKVRVHVVALAPNPKRDQQGSRLVLGLALLGLISIGLGVFAGWQHRTRPGRLALVVGAPAAIALVLTTVLQFGFGALVGSWFVNVGLLFLSAVAIATPIEAVGRRYGRSVLTSWASVFIITGFPYWTNSTIWQVLDSPLAKSFQVFPVPAMNTVVRSANFFDFNNFWFAFIVLLVWASPSVFALLGAGREFWVMHDRSPRFMDEPIPDIPPQWYDPTTADLGRFDT